MIIPPPIECVNSICPWVIASAKIGDNVFFRFAKLVTLLHITASSSRVLDAAELCNCLVCWLMNAGIDPLVLGICSLHDGCCCALWLVSCQFCWTGCFVTFPLVSTLDVHPENVLDWTNPGKAGISIDMLLFASGSASLIPDVVHSLPEFSNKKCHCLPAFCP